jgi:putative DNA primase/helicase
MRAANSLAGRKSKRMSAITDKQGASQDGWLWYRKSKLAIFPCYEKKPLTKDGFKSASNDPDKIAAMWEGCPDNTQVGIATGAVNRLLVLDLDSPEAEDYARAQGWLDKETFCVETSKDCHRHYYFLQPAGVRTKSTAGKIFKGLDIRGDGGYVIGPGSIHHETGLPYTPVSLAVKRAPAPESLLKLVSVNGDNPEPNPESSGLGDIPYHQRNVTLASFAGSMRVRGANEAEILDSLRVLNERSCKSPLPDKELRSIAKSIGRYPAGKPRDTAAEDGQDSGWPPITETSNAERFVQNYAADFRYCSDRGVWSAWTGSHWDTGDMGSVMRAMSQISRSIYLEAADEPSENLRKALGAWARLSESRRVQENSAALARWFPTIEVRKFSAIFDRQPMLLNCENGTLNLATGELEPHHRQDYLTKKTSVVFDPGAKCPRFEQFLVDTFAGRAGLISYVKRITGYFLSGLTSEQKWWLFFGPTSSGKSTFVRVLHGILEPYAFSLPEHYFLADYNSSDFVTAMLPGVRLATCKETNEGKRLNVARIKTLTGEDEISAALKFQNQFSFRPVSKLVLVTNCAPRVPAGDDALWRRLKVVPFDVTVAADKVIPGLADRLLREEASGILNWALEGMKEWLESGLSEPREIAAAVAQYRRDEDVLADFLAEQCVLTPDARETKKAIVGAYADFCRENNMRPWSATKLTQELLRFNVTVADDKRHYLGIRLGQTVTV